MLDQFDRPLTGAEKGLLHKRQKRLRTRLRRGPWEALLFMAALGTVLCVLTLLASDTHGSIIVPFWVTTTLVVWAIAAGSARRDLQRDARRLEEALELDRAHVVRVRAEAMIVFEEIEDEGAKLAFQIEEGRVLFLCGQDFYPTKRFPSRDFSLVHIRDREGVLVEMRIENQGEKLRPLRTLPADVGRTLILPGHLETIPAELSNLELALERRSAAGGDRPATL
jgi:hypothetical protein